MLTLRVTREFKAALLEAVERDGAASLSDWIKLQLVQALQRR